MSAVDDADSLSLYFRVISKRDNCDPNFRLFVPLKLPAYNYVSGLSYLIFSLGIY